MRTHAYIIDIGVFVQSSGYGLVYDDIVKAVSSYREELGTEMVSP